jgi:hypothetical protein
MSTHLHLVLRLRMLGAITPLPNMPSWRGARLKHRDKFTFPFINVTYESSKLWSKLLRSSLFSNLTDVRHST